MLLPCIYIKPDDDIKKSFNGNIKVSVRSVRKLLKSIGQGNGLIMRAAEMIGKKTGKQLGLFYYQIGTRGTPFRVSNGKKHSRKIKNPQLTIT